MISKFAKSPCPDKQTLKALYESGLNQKQIGDKYDVCYQTVHGWMKKHKIKSRGILHHFVKTGDKNPMWKGDSATYAALHYRVNKQRGKPRLCERCGSSDKKKQYDWACFGDYTNIMDYKRLCRSCHFKYDKSGANKNAGRKKFVSSNTRHS